MAHLLNHWGGSGSRKVSRADAAFAQQSKRGRPESSPTWTSITTTPGFQRLAMHVGVSENLGGILKGGYRGYIGYIGVYKV